MGARFFFFFFFLINRLSARAVRLDFIRTTDFGGSEHSEEKVYEVYILFELSWSAISIGTGASSYKRLVRVSPIFSAFTESFLELLRVCSTLAYC